MDYFDKMAEMFRENLKQYIIINLKNNYYAYQTKPVEEIDTYETISKRWEFQQNMLKNSQKKVDIL